MSVTEKMLQAKVDEINRSTGQELEPWTRQPDGTLKANVGTYVLDWCFGGVRLSQMHNAGGAQHDLTVRGTNRETMRSLRAFLEGLCTAYGIWMKYNQTHSLPIPNTPTS